MKKETPVKNALILCAITLVAGALLAIVNQLTLGPIEKAQLAAQAEAYVSVYPDADHFGAVDGAEELLAGSKEQLSAAGIQNVEVTDMMTALDASDNLIGYVLSVTDGAGYGGDITVALGIDLKGTVTGFSPLQHSETPGYGAKCEEEGYIDQFPGITSADQIDGIAGATFTTNAIHDAVAGALQFIASNFLS